MIKLKTCIWYPSAKQGEQARRKDLPSRIVIHTTETSAGTGRTVADNLDWPYHIIADPVKKEALQLISLDKTAYSLVGGRYGYETNHAGNYCVQICIVGYAKDMHLLTDEQLNWLSAIIGEAVKVTNVPNVWYQPFTKDGFLATENSAIRMSPTKWHSFNGICGHQHVPFNDHWDPGALNDKKLQANIEKMLRPQEDQNMIEELKKQVNLYKEVAQARGVRIKALRKRVDLLKDYVMRQRSMIVKLRQYIQTNRDNLNADDLVAKLDEIEKSSDK